MKTYNIYSNLTNELLDVTIAYTISEAEKNAEESGYIDFYVVEVVQYV